MQPKIGLSEFARKRNKPGLGKSHFKGSPDNLLSLILKNWQKRVPGDGHEDLCTVVKVEVPPAGFVTSVVPRKIASEIISVRQRRRPHEEPYISQYAVATNALSAKFAEIVLYSRKQLENSGEDYNAALDWEIVSICATPYDKAEPMHPFTMARNQLELAGGSFAEYSSLQYARALVYWDEHIQLRPESLEAADILDNTHGRPLELVRIARQALASDGPQLIDGYEFARKLVAWNRSG